MKSTKKSLLLSALSLMMCVAMLLGTTYAWFTDSVTSGKNKIIAGNLDVELYAGATQVKSDTKLFSGVTLWEPGAAAYETLTVKNVGNLALKYQLNLLFDNETKVDGHGLSDVLKVGTFDGTVAANAKREDVITQVGSNWQSLASFVKSGNLAANTDDTAVTYVIYWEPGDNDNFFNMNNGNQDKTLSIDFYVELVATQDTVEIDSFNKLYDEKAFLPVISTAAVAESGATVVEDETNEITVTAPEGSLPAGVTTLKLYVEEAAKPANIVVASSQESITAEVTLKDQDGNKVAANGETLFTVEMKVGKDRENLKVYHSGSEMTDVTPNTPDANNEYSYDFAAGIVTMTIADFSPFTFAYDKESWISHAEEVEVDDITITTAAQLAGFAKNINAGKTYAGKTVTLGADIDLGAYMWKVTGTFYGIFDGANHKISNMIVADMNTDYVGFFSVLSGCAKNVTFVNASVIGQRCGILAGAMGDYLVDNVTVLDSEIYGEQKCGGIVGFAGGKTQFHAHNIGEIGTDAYEELTINGCTVKNLTMHGINEGGASMGGVAGFISAGYPKNVVISNNVVSGIVFKDILDESFYTEYAPLYEQYLSHPLVGALISKKSNSGDMTPVFTFTNNTVEQVTGIPTGGSTTEYFGFCYSNLSAAAGSEFSTIYINGELFDITALSE